MFISRCRFESRSELATWVHCIAVRTIVKVARGIGRAAAAKIRRTKRTLRRARLSTRKTETDQRVWDAVAKLEPRQAAAVELFDRRGWSVEEIAQTLECPANISKTLLSRARKDFADC